MFDFELALKPRRGGRLFGIGMEAIDFQTDNFGSKLEAIFYDIEKFITENSSKHEDALRAELSKSEFPNLISDTIFKRVGIRTKIILNTYTFGMVMPFFVNQNHVLLDKMWRGNLARELPDQTKLLKQFNGKKGSIDLHNARVGGIFSEYKHDLWIDVVGHILTYKSSIPEIVAILLHEIGHAFTYYELADRLETTNQIMAQLSAELRSKNDTSEKKVLFRELEKSFGVKEGEMDELIDENNQTILGLKLFKRYVEMVKSQTPHEKYNETASEQVADNFAARFGYGRHLITGLNNIHVKFNSPEVDESNAKMAFVMELVFLHILPFLGLLCNFIIGVTPFGLLMPVLWILLFVNSGDNDKDMTYDELKIRYKRVRQQYIEMIQKLDMDKEQLRAVIDDVHSIDEIIKGTSIYRTIFNRLANFAFASNREAKNDIELQYLIEDLSHNDLFLKSAELSVIS